MISVEHNIDAFYRSLSDLARKQLPFAAAQALNDTGDDVKDDWAGILEKRLDRPTPFTKRGTYLRRASKSRLGAQVGFKDIQSRYLQMQATGGVRRPKGRAIPVPVGQKLNRYGNMPRGAVGRLAGRKDTFVGKVRGVGGIWKRPGKRARKTTGPKLLVAFEGSASYRKRLDVQTPAHARARSVFSDHLVRRLKAAIATSR